MKDVKQRINKYYGEGTWDKLTDLDKQVFIANGAYKLYKQKKENTLPDLKDIRALKS